MIVGYQPIELATLVSLFDETEIPKHSISTPSYRVDPGCRFDPCFDGICHIMPFNPAPESPVSGRSLPLREYFTHHEVRVGKCSLELALNIDTTRTLSLFMCLATGSPDGRDNPITVSMGLRGGESCTCTAQYGE